jgi:hypothetical protein
VYELQVHEEGALKKRVQALGASDVLQTIPQLLKDHPDCEKVVVMMGLTPLFAVDCKGNRLRG